MAAHGVRLGAEGALDHAGAGVSGVRITGSAGGRVPGVHRRPIHPAGHAFSLHLVHGALQRRGSARASRAGVGSASVRAADAQHSLRWGCHLLGVRLGDPRAWRGAPRALAAVRAPQAAPRRGGRGSALVRRFHAAVEDQRVALRAPGLPLRWRRGAFERDGEARRQPGEHDGRRALAARRNAGCADAVAGAAHPVGGGCAARRCQRGRGAREEDGQPAPAPGDGRLLLQRQAGRQQRTVPGYRSAPRCRVSQHLCGAQDRAHRRHCRLRTPSAARTGQGSDSSRRDADRSRRRAFAGRGAVPPTPREHRTAGGRSARRPEHHHRAGRSGRGLGHHALGIGGEEVHAALGQGPRRPRHVLGRRTLHRRPAPETAAGREVRRGLAGAAPSAVPHHGRASAAARYFRPRDRQGGDQRGARRAAACVAGAGQRGDRTQRGAAARHCGAGAGAVPEERALRLRRAGGQVRQGERPAPLARARGLGDRRSRRQPDGRFGVGSRGGAGAATSGALERTPRQLVGDHRAPSGAGQRGAGRRRGARGAERQRLRG